MGRLAYYFDQHLLRDIEAGIDFRPPKEILKLAFLSNLSFQQTARAMRFFSFIKTTGTFVRNVHNDRQQMFLNQYARSARMSRFSGFPLKTCGNDGKKRGQIVF